MLDRRSSRYGADGDVLCCKMVLARIEVVPPASMQAAGCIHPGVSSRNHDGTPGQTCETFAAICSSGIPAMRNFRR